MLEGKNVLLLPREIDSSWPQAGPGLDRIIGRNGAERFDRLIESDQTHADHAID